MSSKKTCSRCGAENAPHLRYCSMCGSTLASANAQGFSTTAKPGSTGPNAEPAALGPTPAERPAGVLQGAPMQAVGMPANATALPRPFDRNPDAALLESTAVSATSEPTRPPPAPDASVATNNALLSSSKAAPHQNGGRRGYVDPDPTPTSPRAGSGATAVGKSEQRCWRCGTNSGATAAFCQGCGAPLREGSLPGMASAAPPPARLIVIAQDGSSGQEYPIQGGQIDIGRESGDVRIAADGYACPRHARISWKNGNFWVSDLGSVNGVFVRLTEPERLHHGDVILIGMGVVRFEIVSAHETGIAPAIERGTRLFGSPATPRYARLVERTVEGIARNVLYLSKNVVTIGRETGDIVFTDDPFMSRQHAGLERQGDGSFVLKDLGSSNGTFLAIRGERMLPNGSHIRIGQHLFRLKVEA